MSKVKAIEAIGYRQPLIRYKYKTIAIEQWCHLDGESEMVTPQTHACARGAGGSAGVVRGTTNRGECSPQTHTLTTATSENKQTK